MNNRDKNRAEFPDCTEAFDMIREMYPDARVLWASENGKEIGKRPTLSKNEFEISAENYELAAAGLAGRQGRGRK